MLSVVEGQQSVYVKDAAASLGAWRAPEGRGFIVCCIWSMEYAFNCQHVISSTYGCGAEQHAIPRQASKEARCAAEQHVPQGWHVSCEILAKGPYLRSNDQAHACQHLSRRYIVVCGAVPCQDARQAHKGDAGLVYPCTRHKYLSGEEQCGSAVWGGQGGDISTTAFCLLQGTCREVLAAHEGHVDSIMICKGNVNKTIHHVIGGMVHDVRVQGVTWTVKPMAAVRTTQQRMPNRCMTFSRRPRKIKAKTAAKSISAPRIIWYTLAVTLSKPTFIRTVAMRSKTVGIASNRSCLTSLWSFGCVTTCSDVSTAGNKARSGASSAALSEAQELFEALATVKKDAG